MFLMERDVLLLASSPSSSTSEAVGKIADGNYEEVIMSETGISVVRSILGSGSSLANPWDELCVGVACLLSFLQAAWTGPELTFSMDDIVSSSSISRQNVIRSFASDGEDFYHLTPHVHLLYIAERIFEKEFADLKLAAWWKARCAFVRQRCLDGPSATLKSGILDGYQRVQDELRDIRDIELGIRLALEKGLVHQYYGEDALAVECFKRAQTLRGLKWELTGAQGKRTKFQQFDVTQLVLLASSDGNSDNIKEESSSVPENLALNDDVILESVKFTHAKADTDEFKKSTQGALDPIDQSILLAFCLDVKSRNPSKDDTLTNEEMAAFIQRVIQTPQNWTLHTMALLIRSRLERGKSRTIERSVLQIQALVDQIPCLDSGVNERLKYWFCVLEPSRWDLERELAEQLVSLGVIRSAMDIFERLEMWEDVVKCLQMLEETKKAEELIVRLLKDDPKSPKLLCIYGDITQDPARWEAAWEVSGKRYARAMRSLGASHFKHGDYEKAVECYKLALAINSLFINSWFILGCAGMQIENWTVSAEAFSRVVALEDDNAEAWSNLGTVRGKMEDRDGAYLAYEQAVRHKRESWKMWMNFITAAIEASRFREAIRGLAHLGEVRQPNQDGFLDLSALEVVTRAVHEANRSVEGEEERVEVEFARKELDKLYVLLVGKTSKNAALYELYAGHLRWRKLYREAFDARMNGYRVRLNESNPSQDEPSFITVATSALDMHTWYNDLVSEVRRTGVADGDTWIGTWKQQLRSLLRSLIGRTRENFEDHQKHVALTEAYDALVSKE